MAFQNPTVNDFKTYFTRDFPYGTDPGTTILDSDISKAFGQSNMQINQALFSAQEDYSIGYNLLSAHYLVTNIRTSSQGLNGQYNFLQQSKSVGSISEAFGIPQEILDNPNFSMLCKTNYGAMYLQLILPLIVGQIFTVAGTTRP